jgi:agmatinase
VGKALAFKIMSDAAGRVGNLEGDLMSQADLWPASTVPRVPFSSANICNEQTFTAAHTFLRTPRMRSAVDCDVAILGVPFDLATSNRPGARFGPDAIRVASAQLGELKAYPGGFDPLQYLKAVDLGDVYLDYGNPHTLPAAIEAAAAKVIADGAFLCALGGDHFISYPLIKAHAKKYGPVALVHFDAHTDTWRSTNPLDGPPELNHGTMFCRAIDEGLIDVTRSVQTGIRTWVDDAMGMTIIDNVMVETNRASDIAKAICDIAGGGPVYLTVDIDCLDPAYAPGTGTPVTGGLAPVKLLQILRGIASLNIVGFDLVEVAPVYDNGGITALNAATIVYEQIVRMARKKGAPEEVYAKPRVKLPSKE